MKEETIIENKVKKFKDTCIDRYNALYLENNYQKGNKLEKKLIVLGQELIVLQIGIYELFKMLKDENEIVRYYSASIIFSLYPKESRKVLKEIEKNGKTHLASNVKYVIKNYDEGNNYFQKFLEESKK